MDIIFLQDEQIIEGRKVAWLMDARLLLVIAVF